MRLFPLPLVAAFLVALLAPLSGQEEEARGATAPPAGTDPSVAASRPDPAAEERVRRKAARERKGRRPVENSDADDSETSPRGPLSAELTSLFPVGREFRGVSIPSYTETSLKSVLKADLITRIDETHLELTNLVIHLYNGSAEAETTIRMDLALYHIALGDLVSQTPAKIEQARFTMTGDTMIFNTETQISRLVGDVRVVVPDAKQMAPAMPFGLPGSQ